MFSQPSGCHLPWLTNEKCGGVVKEDAAIKGRKEEGCWCIRYEERSKTIVRRRCMGTGYYFRTLRVSTT